MTTRRQLTFALALCLASCAAYAGELQLGAGRCNATKSLDGDLWQSERWHLENLRAPCAELRYASTAPGLGWAIGYTYLGTWRSQTDAVADDERTAAVDCQPNGAHCLQRLTGVGAAQGVEAGLTWRTKWLTPELGVLAYRYRWYETITHPNECGQECTSTHTYDFSAVNLTSYARLTATAGPIYAAATRFSDIEGKKFRGIATGPLWQFTFGVRWELP